MKSFYLMLIASIAIVGCQPTDAMVQTAIAKTQSAVSAQITPTAFVFPTIPTVDVMPVPVSVGTPITYKSLQITLLDVSEHDLIWTGDDMAYYPKAGSHVVDVVLSIRRGLSVSPVRVAWKSISVHQTDGLGWYTNFGGMSDSDEPPKIRMLTPEQDIDLAGVHTLRLAFFIPDKPQKLKLYVGDSWIIFFDNP